MEELETFQQRLSRERMCSESGFDRWIFWHCLHRHAVPIAPLILIFHRNFFSADCELIEEIRKAHTVSEVWRKVDEFFCNPDHEQHWWHRQAKVRVSGERLMFLARRYLPASGDQIGKQSGPN